MTESYETKASAVAWGVQPDGDVGGFQFGTPKTFQASANGAADGTTIVSAGLADYIDSNDDLVEELVECIAAENRANRGMRAMIRRVDTGTDTFYVDAFPDQVKADDEFYLLLNPAPKAVVDTGQLVATKQITDATRNETTGTWVGSAEEGGYYVQAEETDNSSADVVRRITAQTDAGVITLVDELEGNTIIGDLFRIRKFPSVEGVLDPSQEDIKRAPHVGGIGKPPSVQGPRAGAGTLTLAKRGPGRTRRGLTSELHEALRCLFDCNPNGDVVCDTGSSGTSIKYASGTPEVGTFLITEAGDVVFVLADDEVDTLTVWPAPQSDPLVGQTLRKLQTYTPAALGLPNAALSIDQWRGSGIYELFVGVQPVPTFSGQRGEKTKIALECRPLDFYQSSREDSADPLERLYFPRLPTVDALACTDNRVVVGSTEVPVINWQFAPAPQLSYSKNQARPNGVDAQIITDWAPTGQLVVRVTSTLKRTLADFEARLPQKFFLQDGSAPGFPGVLAFFGYSIVYTGAGITDDEGKSQQTLPFEVVRDEDALEADLPLFAIGQG